MVVSKEVIWKEIKIWQKERILNLEVRGVEKGSNRTDCRFTFIQPFSDNILKIMINKPNKSIFYLKKSIDYKVVTGQLYSNEF